MVSMKNNRLKEINDMVSIVKLASLLFTSIIFFQYVLKESEGLNNWVYKQLMFIALGGILLFLLAIYLLWALSLEEKISKSRYRKIIFIEGLFFVAIFLGAIIISGGYKSEYKYIFLFKLFLIKIR